MIELLLLLTLSGQSHPCDGTQPTSYEVPANAVYETSWCQSKDDLIEGFTILWNGNALPVALGDKPGPQVAAKIGSPNSAGMQEWRTTLFFGVGGHRLSIQAWNRDAAGQPQASSSSMLITVTASDQPPPPPPPPLDPCVAQPITLTVTAWPTKNRKTRADFSVYSPRGTATVTFAFQGQTSISATANDGTCSITVAR